MKKLLTLLLILTSFGAMAQVPSGEDTTRTSTTLLPSPQWYYKTTQYGRQYYLSNSALAKNDMLMTTKYGRAYYMQRFGGNSGSGNQALSSGNFTTANGSFGSRDVGTGRIGYHLGTRLYDSGAPGNYFDGYVSGDAVVASDASILLKSYLSGTQRTLTITGSRIESHRGDTVLYSGNGITPIYASNGLVKDVDTIKLGGSLTTNTTITGDIVYQQLIGNLGTPAFSNFAMTSTNMGIGLVGDNGTGIGGSQFNITPAYIKITDGINKKGIEYNGNYRGNFTQYSLIDKGYADSLATGVSSLSYTKAQTDSIAALKASLSSATFGSNTIPYQYYYGFGDSLGAAVGASSTALGYVGRIGTYLGITPINSSVSGDQTADQAVYVYGTTISNNTYQLSTLQLGSNDVAVYTSTDQKANFKAIHYALETYLAIPDINKIKGQGSSVPTYGGTWANSSLYGGSIGKVSATNGSTATFSVNGTVAYIGYTMEDGNTGTASYTVDGGAPVAFNCYGQAGSTVLTSHGQAYAPALLRITGLSAGSHTIVITVTSATAAGNKVYFDWAAGNGNLYPNAGKPTVLIANIPQRFNQSTLPLYSAIVEDNVANLIADGINVKLVPIQDVLNQSTNENPAFGSHPNDLGYAVIYNVYRSVINVANNFADVLVSNQNTNLKGDVNVGGNATIANVVTGSVTSASGPLTIGNNIPLTQSGSAIGIGDVKVSNSSGQTYGVVLSNEVNSTGATTAHTDLLLKSTGTSTAPVDSQFFAKAYVDSNYRFSIRKDGTGFFAGRMGVDIPSTNHTLAVGNLGGGGIGLYNTTDYTTNYERLKIYFNSNVLTVITQKGGTGVEQDIKLNAGNSGRGLYVSALTAKSTGGLYQTTFNELFASSGAINTSIAAVSGTMSNTSGINYGLGISTIWNQASGTGGSADFRINRTETALGSGAHKFASFQVAASEKFAVSNLGTIFSTTLTASSLLGSDASKNIVTITALPSGTTATTQAVATNNTTIATTAYVQSHFLSNTATLDFPSTVAGTPSDLTIPVTGVAIGDVVIPGIPNGSVTPTAVYTAWVSAADTVKIRLTTHNTEDPASGTFKVTVIK